MRALALVAALPLVACGEDAPPRDRTFGGDRPVDLRTPPTLTEGKQYPLVVLLHGFGANGFAQYAYFGLGALVDSDAAFVLAPDGTTNRAGRQFWNADPACCDFDGQNPDDVAYLGGLIDDVTAAWPVDPDAVFVIGHSNGGYMSYRMACERADAIAAIMSLAGNAATMETGCTPSRPVSVLHLHGTLDDSVPYDGGATGAVASVQQWARHDGCGTTRTTTIDADLDTLVDGVETHGETTSGCPAGVAVELWRMDGSGHIPLFPATFATQHLLPWLLGHAR